MQRLERAEVVRAFEDDDGLALGLPGREEEAAWREGGREGGREGRREGGKEGRREEEDIGLILDIE